MDRRRVCSCLLAMLTALSCGGTATRNHADSDGDTGGSAGGISATSATAAGNTGASEGGRTGGTGTGGGGGTDATGPAAITNERERELLEPLWTESNSLTEASGDELLELTHDIALARGYALCRCVDSADAPPEDIEWLVQSCAVHEAPYGLGEESDRRCMSELRGDVPEFDAHLRCLAAVAQRDAVEWFALCTDLEMHPPKLEGPAECVAPSGFLELQQKCIDAIDCADGSLGFGWRCDGRQACADLSDEFECFDDVGQDTVLCPNGLVASPEFLCSSGYCGLSFEPEVCDAESSSVFVCSDRTKIDLSWVCNRENDCPGAEDEAICLR